MHPAVPGVLGEGEMLMAVVADQEGLPEAWYMLVHMQFHI